MSNMVRAISENGGIVAVAIDSTNIVREMERIHKPSAVVSAALGRLLTGASMMGTWLKNDQDSITVRMSGDGPIGTVLAVTDADGNVRGYAAHPIVEIPLREDGKLDVGGAVGAQGTLAVIKDLGMKEPYIGQVPLVSGEVAEDITSYYAVSEQTPTVCSLGVLVDKDLSIRCAGGYLLQLLPGATEEEIEQLEKNIQNLDSITSLLEKGTTPEEIAMTVLKGFDPQILEERDVAYKCYCSQEKTEKILISLGKQELQDIIDEAEPVEVCCHFCGKTYHFDLDEVEKIRENATT